MKRIGNLYEKIISVENLKLADENAQKGKKDQYGVINHNHRRLRKSIKKRWIKMLRKYPNRKSKASYNSWLTHCNSVNLQRKYYSLNKTIN